MPFAAEAVVAAAAVAVVAVVVPVALGAVRP